MSVQKERYIVKVHGRHTVSRYHTRECRAVRRMRNTAEVDEPQPHWKECKYCSGEWEHRNTENNERECPMCDETTKNLGRHLSGGCDAI